MPRTDRENALASPATNASDHPEVSPRSRNDGTLSSSESDTHADDETLAHDHAAASCCCHAHTQGNEAFDELPDEELLYDLADLFKVFADTTRIKILYALMGSELCVADIADMVGATQSVVSHQLRTLKQAHLVKFKRDGKNVRYSLSDDHVHTMLAQGMSHICE